MQDLNPTSGLEQNIIENIPQRDVPTTYQSRREPPSRFSSSQIYPTNSFDRLSTVNDNTYQENELFDHERKESYSSTDASKLNGNKKTEPSSSVKPKPSQKSMYPQTPYWFLESYGGRSSRLNKRHARSIKEVR